MRKLRLGRLLLALTLLIELAHAQKLTVLYNFAGTPDGASPMASLVDANGALYGTTYVGGTGPCTINGFLQGCGTVFKVGGKKETVLHRFQGQPDGAFPLGSLVRNKSGKLFGATSGGGAYNLGAIFWVTAKKETVLYSFKGAPDGADPTGGLLQDASGNFYGTTSGGGANLGYGGNSSGGGTIFKLDAKGNETVLYNFCSAVNCADGVNPASGVIMDASGNLYGTTQFGGTSLGSDGTVFKVDASGNQTVLYNFCSEQGCADGEDPVAGLIMDAKGNLYGTTLYGGAGVYGTVFEFDTAGAFDVLYSFGPAPGPIIPAGGLVFNAKGTLYGTTEGGGSGTCELSFCGTVFKLKP
jgi:uncharacterized repeat protein (TIGR03803 family)